MVDFSEYLNFLEELEHTLQQLVDVEQKKSAAVSARDLDALNDCMKRARSRSHHPPLQVPRSPVPFFRYIHA